MQHKLLWYSAPHSGLRRKPQFAVLSVRPLVKYGVMPHLTHREGELITLLACSAQLVCIPGQRTDSEPNQWKNRVNKKLRDSE
jgi:hypothetical protein